MTKKSKRANDIEIEAGGRTLRVSLEPIEWLIIAVVVVAVTAILYL